MNSPKTSQNVATQESTPHVSSASNTPSHAKKSQKTFMLLAGIIFIIIIIGVVFYLASSKKSSYQQPPPASNSTMEKTKQLTRSFQKLSAPELLFTGGFADPTVVKNTDGSLVMYLNNFSVQPAKYQAYTSDDGKTWKLSSAKLPQASTGRAVKFGTTTRLYYPERTPIRPTDPPASILSALSPDGFTFTTESGPRVYPKDGYYLEGPTVFKVGNAYRMYFSENETASAEKRISKIWGASSKDGIVWERDAAATIEANEQDEHIPPGWPQALHPFVLTRPDGTYLMFYNTHSQVFAATSEDGIKWEKLGDIGIRGADVDGYYLPDGSIRLYYGDFSEQSSGVVYTIDIKEG